MNRFIKNPPLITIVVVVVVALGALSFYLLDRSRDDNGSSPDDVNSYEECDRLYHANAEFFTGTCTTPDGRTFTSPEQ